MAAQYEVIEVASDKTELKDQLNSLAPELELHTILWANGKLLLVARGRCQELRNC